MPGNTSRRYPDELKSRAVRMVVETRAEGESEWAVMTRVAHLLGGDHAGDGSKVGSSGPGRRGLTCGGDDRGGR